MIKKQEETASFVLRLSQKIYNSEEGEHQIRYRGNIRHVQSGDETRFSTFENASEFVKNKLSEMTLKAVENIPEDAQKGIIAKSFDFWKKVASATPKIVIDSIKDPKKQATHLQEQIQEQIHNFSEKIEDKIGNKIEIENWLPSAKAEHKELMALIHEMSNKIDVLNQKIEDC